LPNGFQSFERAAYYRTTRELVLSAGEAHVIDL